MKLCETYLQKLLLQLDTTVSIFKFAGKLRIKHNLELIPIPSHFHRTQSPDPEDVSAELDSAYRDGTTSDAKEYLEN